jgi:recombination protein RecA
MDRRRIAQIAAAPISADRMRNYFASGKEGKSQLSFLSSGCQLFDCALGGGYVLGRIVNIVGDKSSGKTLLAMEAIANFFIAYPAGWVRYNESEAAFDREYAAALGIPVDLVIFNKAGAPTRLVEEVYADMELMLDTHKGRPGLYIIDSLDALSDQAEDDREFTDASYGGSKPKKIGELLRRMDDRLGEQDVLLIVISQIRDKLNVTFGETKTRSGGRALDFYASHIVWLAEKGKIKRTIRGIERVVGIEVIANVKKNKVGPAFRTAEYPILFGYGIDDMTSSIEWLIEVGRERLIHPLGIKKGASTRAKTKEDAAKAAAAEKAELAGLKPYKDRVEELRNKGGQESATMRQALGKLVRDEWEVIELTFLPKATKY